MEKRLHLHINWSGNLGGHTNYCILKDWQAFRWMYVNRVIANLKGKDEPNYRPMPKPRIVIFDFE